MKKLGGFMILSILLLSLSVIAGDILKLDFSDKNQQLVGLKKGDSAEFYLKGERNIVIIDEIKPDSVDITAFIALNSGNHPHYITLSSKRTLKIDIERDDIPDLYVGWYTSNADLEYAYLIIQKPESITLTGSTVEEVKREKRMYDKYIISGFILAICLLVGFISYEKFFKSN